MFIFMLTYTFHALCMEQNTSNATHNQLLIQFVKRGEPKMVKNILEQGADSNTIDYSCKPPKSVLHIAIDSYWIDITKILLKHGASANAINEYKETALHRACIKGSPGIVQLLLEHGANINALTHDNNTALHCYCQHAGQHPHPHRVIIKALLLEGLSIDTCNNKLELPIAIACSNNNLSLVEVLIENGAMANESCISSTQNKNIKALCKAHLYPAVEKQYYLENCLKITVLFAGLLCASTCTIL